jgi:hypothetical protein
METLDSMTGGKSRSLAGTLGLLVSPLCSPRPPRPPAAAVTKLVTTGEGASMGRQCSAVQCSHCSSTEQHCALCSIVHCAAVQCVVCAVQARAVYIVECSKGSLAGNLQVQVQVVQVHL